MTLVNKEKPLLIQMYAHVHMYKVVSGAKAQLLLVQREADVEIKVFTLQFDIRQLGQLQLQLTVSIGE